MPAMDGLEATRTAAGRAAPEPAAPRVIILTTFELDEYVFEALRAGASGFLIKNAPPEDLVAASGRSSRAVPCCRPASPPGSSATFAHRRAGDLDARRIEALTEREREVLVLVGRGLSNQEIAARLVVGEATVKTHVSSILAKLDVRDRVGAVIMAYESGLIEIGAPEVD